jgi:hypothetical protein
LSKDNLNKEINEKQITRIDTLYKNLIAPTTFFILISFQWGLYVLADIYKLNISEKLGVTPNSLDVILPYFNVLTQSLFLSISLFIYIISYLKEFSFGKIISLYFLLISLFLATSGYLAILTPKQLEIFLTPLTIFIPFAISFNVLFDWKKHFKFYTIIFILNIILCLIIQTYNFNVFYFSIVNILISYIYHKK